MNPAELAAFKPETPGELPLRRLVVVFPDEGEGAPPLATAIHTYAATDDEALARVYYTGQRRQPAHVYEIENDGTLRHITESEEA